MLIILQQVLIKTRQGVCDFAFVDEDCRTVQDDKIVKESKTIADRDVTIVEQSATAIAARDVAIGQTWRVYLYRYEEEVQRIIVRGQIVPYFR